MANDRVLVQNGLRFLRGKPLSIRTAVRAENCLVFHMVQVRVRALCKRALTFKLVSSSCVKYAPTSQLEILISVRIFFSRTIDVFFLVEQ